MKKAFSVFAFCVLFCLFLHSLNQVAFSKAEEINGQHILNARQAVTAQFKELPAIDPSSGILITEEMYLAKPSCSRGFQLKRISNGDQGFYCSNGHLMQGPFTNEMIQKCLQKGHSKKLCLSNYWPLSFAQHLRGENLCPIGATFDVQTKYCKEGNLNLGPFTQSMRKLCQQEEINNSPICKSDKWPRELVLKIQDKSFMQIHSYNQVLQEIKQNKEIYKIPTVDDLERDTMRKVEVLSEEVLPPFVLAPRRQTDSLTRQLHELLPTSVKEETAFVLADRLVQNPDAYLNYLKGKKKIVIIGSFWGIGELKSKKEKQYVFILHQHEQQFYKLKASIAIAQSLGLQIEDIVYGLGDLNSPISTTIRDSLQARYNYILTEAGLKNLIQPLSWGVDELVAVAFARQLAKQKIFIRISNPQARQFMDGRKIALSLVKQKIAELGLSETTNKSEADLIAYIFTRKNTKFIDDFQPNDNVQRELDKKFMREILSLSSEENKKLVLIDARLFNGAWDAKALPTNCDYLSFGSWGTFSNNIGATLAQAKILNSSPNNNIRKRMLLEAVYHDVFFNGHETVQRGEAQKLLDKHNINFSHFEGYESPEQTALVFKLLNEKANLEMQKYFENTQCMKQHYVRATPQYWRTFESEVHLLPVPQNTKLITGLYRKDLPPETFDPTYDVKIFQSNL